MDAISSENSDSNRFIEISTQPTFFGKRRVGTFPCLSCGCWNSIIKGDSFNHLSKGYHIKLQHFATCTTTGVIHMLKCPFGKAYVVKTKREVRTRIGEHKRTITNCDLEKQKYVTPVSRHFLLQGHNSNQLRRLVLQVVNILPRGGDYNRILLQKEIMWIDRLNSTAPMGLNEHFNYSCFF
ncbi:hypothetical protein XELAEV_18028992mg [Xenopus laevis]|uniref:Uncharacterized protein n=1 Tax=Xenopus laevis TaxID=8355 RepID=A0A974CSJ6_XENLA|nr:hypothetical protein XELAEV_18028992mg [Xenopus laevis]